MKLISKRIFSLLVVLVSSTPISGWSSQLVWEEKDAKAQLMNVREKCYSVQLCSFTIPSGENASQVAEQELNRLTNVAEKKGYRLSQHVLFSSKATNDSYARCAAGAFSQVGDAEILRKTLGDIFISEKPFVINPANITNVPLDFVIYRPAK